MRLIEIVDLQKKNLNLHDDLVIEGENKNIIGDFKRFTTIPLFSDPKGIFEKELEKNPMQKTAYLL